MIDWEKQFPMLSLTRQHLKDAVADPKILARFKDDGGVPMVMAPGALAQFLADDKARWRKMVDAAGITAE